jgi:hypothetical protein
MSAYDTVRDTLNQYCVPAAMYAGMTTHELAAMLLDRLRARNECICRLADRTEIANVKRPSDTV